MEKRNILRDIRCFPQIRRVGVEDKIIAYISGDYYIGAENKYNPIRESIVVDLDGLFRLQREINEAIEQIARGTPKLPLDE